MWLSELAVLVATLLSVANAGDQQPLGGGSSLASSIRKSLKENKVIGDVLDDFEPTVSIELAYHHEEVLLGNDIPVKHVQDRPILAIHSIPSAQRIVDSDDTYTLALTDPDAKSRSNPKWSEMCHWLLTNLTTGLPMPDPPNNESPSAFKLPGELKGYKPPGPPPKTGAHRYVFVLLKGPAHDLAPPKDRQHWGYGKVRHGVRDWAKDNNLTVIGANFFFAQNKKQ
jgi:phosphatidylethanolamine-binding protein